MAAGVGGGVVVDEGELGVGKLVGHGGKGGDRMSRNSRDIWDGCEIVKRSRNLRRRGCIVGGR